MEQNNNTKDILHKLSKYYREIIKYVASSASRVLQNVVTGQKYGLVADLFLFVKDVDQLKKQTIIIRKPKKNVELEKFIEEETSEDINNEENPEELEITDEEIAWSTINKIWRTQENNPYERETLTDKQEAYGMKLIQYALKKGYVFDKALDK